MNLMFRKNFREGAGKSSGGGGGIKLTSKANRSQGKRSRDMGYGNMDADVHYRTHLFFSPNRGGNLHDCEGLCFYVVRAPARASLTLCVCTFLSYTYLFFSFYFISLCLSHHLLSLYFLFLKRSLHEPIKFSILYINSCNP